MARNVIFGAFALLLCCTLAPTAKSQDTLLSQLYGKGVHSYFSGDYDRAHDLFSMAIDQGTRDPRCYYYRGLVYSRLGRPDEADADFEQGAKLEAAGEGIQLNVGSALQRVQGPTRLRLETARYDAKLAARMEQVKMQRERYEARQANEENVLRSGTVPETIQPPVGETSDPNNPFGDATATPPADVSGGTVDPVTPMPAGDLPDAPATGVGEDPFGTPAPTTPAVPADNDPFGTPAPDSPATPAGSDPFGSPAPAAGGDPFGAPAAGDPAPVAPSPAAPTADPEPVTGENPFADPPGAAAPPAGGDPFGAPAPAAPGGGDPFGAPAPANPAPAAPGGGDPFGAPAPANPAPAAPGGGDPFGAPAPANPAPAAPGGGDPFGAPAPANPAPAAPGGGDPFGAPAPANPAPATPPAAGQPADKDVNPFEDDPPTTGNDADPFGGNPFGN